jgi:hypothetical protein
VSAFSLRRVTPIDRQAITDPPARQVLDAVTDSGDIVERALAILDTESKDWVEGQHRKYPIATEFDMRPTSAS